MLKLASATSPENWVFAGKQTREKCLTAVEGSYRASALHLYPKATGVCTTWVGGLVQTLVAFGSLCQAEAGHATSVVNRVLQCRVQTLAAVVSEVAFMCPKKELRSIQSCQA